MRKRPTLAFSSLVAFFLFRPLPAYSQNAADICRIYLEFLDELRTNQDTAKSILAEVETRISALNFQQTFATEFKSGQIEPLTHFGTIRKAMPTLLPRLLRQALSRDEMNLPETDRKVFYLRNIFWGKESTKPLADAMHTLFLELIPEKDNPYDLGNLRFAQKLGFRGTADFAAFVSTLSSDHFAAWLRTTLNGPTGGVEMGVYDLPTVARALGIKPFIHRTGIVGLAVARVKGSIKPITLHPALVQIAKPPHSGGELSEALEWLREQRIVHSAIRTYLFSKGFRSPHAQTAALNDALRSERGIETLTQETMAHLHYASNLRHTLYSLNTWSTRTELERERLKQLLSKAEDEVVVEILNALFQDPILEAKPLEIKGLFVDFKTLLTAMATGALTAGAGALLLPYYYPEISTAASLWLSGGAAAATIATFFSFINRPSSWFRAPTNSRELLKYDADVLRFLRRVFSLREVLQRRLIETHTNTAVDLDVLNEQMLAASKTEHPDQSQETPERRAQQ